MVCLRETILNTALAYFAGVSNFTDYEDFIKDRHPDARHSLYPVSLGVKPRLTNAEMVDMISSVLPGLTEFGVWLADDYIPIIDEAQCKIMVRLLGAGTFDNGDYEQDYFWTAQMTEDGSKILESWEMLDPNVLA